MVGQEDAVTRAGCVTGTAEIFQILRVQPVLDSFFTREQNRPRGEQADRADPVVPGLVVATRLITLMPFGPEWCDPSRGGRTGGAETLARCVAFAWRRACAPRQRASPEGTETASGRFDLIVPQAQRASRTGISVRPSSLSA